MSKGDSSASKTAFYIDSNIKVPDSLTKVSDQFCEERMEKLEGIFDGTEAAKEQTYFCFEGADRQKSRIMEQFERSAKSAGYTTHPAMNTSVLQQFIRGKGETKHLIISYQTEADKLYVMVGHSRPS